MRVLLVHNRYRQAGGEDYVFAAEAGLLEAHGHDVARYTVSNVGLDDVNPLTLATETVWSGRAYGEVRALLRSHRPQIMHLHNSFPRISASVCYAARAAGVPVVQTLHNYRLLCPNGQFFRAGRVCEDCLGRRLATPGITHACYRKSRVATGMVAAMVAIHRMAGTWSRVVDLFIAPTEFARQKFIAGGIPAERIVMKPHFIEYDPGVGGRRGGYALFVGRLSSEKGVEVALAAWERLATRIPLKIVGDGPLAPAVRSAVAERPGIEWLGWQPKAAIYELMRDAALLVFPSLCYETFGLVIAEAYGTGLPVIASDLGSMSSLVAHGRTGLHFRPRDPDDLERQVLWALDHPTEMAAMSGWAREEYEMHFTAERNHRMLLDIYQSLAKSTTRETGVRPDSGAMSDEHRGSIMIGQRHDTEG